MIPPEMKEKSNSEKLINFLVGDVNITLGQNWVNETEYETEAEINIMIAEKKARRKGISTKIVNFLKKEISEKKISKRIVATINNDNL